MLGRPGRGWAEHPGVVILLLPAPNRWTTPVCPPRCTPVPSAEGTGQGVLAHPLAAHRLGRPSRVRFSDPEGNVLFEHPVQKSAAPEDGMVRGAGRAGRRGSPSSPCLGVQGSPAPAQPCPCPQLCGMWRTVSKANIQLLRGEQLRVSLVTRAQPSGEVHGHILKHRALFAGKSGSHVPTWWVATWMPLTLPPPAQRHSVPS